MAPDDAPCAQLPRPTRAWAFLGARHPSVAHALRVLATAKRASRDVEQRLCVHSSKRLVMEAGWGSGLRDGSLETWSRPNKSKALDNVFRKRTNVATASKPKIHSKEAVVIHAAALEEEKKLMAICQKSERTEEEVRFAHAYMTQFPFFKLWPDAVQRELARVLLTEVRVCHETIIARATPLTKVFFLLRGTLQVSVPETAERGDAKRPAAVSAASPDASTTRALATLRKGDTCGEAVLLGNAMAHADVVVTSPGAVMLSLCHADFLRALKEILGLRQQDRLMYLRMHPLFVEVSLEDLDKASDLLHLGFFQPGSPMHTPLRNPSPDAQRVYFVAEGECSVKRFGAASHGPGPSAALQLDADRNPPAYDSDTVSVLGPLDVFGLEPGGGGRALGSWSVEALTQVKAYYFTLDQFQTLPRAMQKAVQDAIEFKARYLKGRAQVLSRLDHARRDPRYGAQTYTLGDARLTTAGHLPAPASRGTTEASAGMGVAGRIGGSTAASRAGTAAAPVNKVTETLERLATAQVRELLQMDAAREAASAVGLPTSAAHDLMATGRLSTMSTTARSLRDTAPRGALRSPPSSRPSPTPLGGLGLSAGAGAGAERMAIHASFAATVAAAAAAAGGSSGVHVPGPETVRLGSLPPDTSTLSRLECARKRMVLTEAPRPQPVPTSVRQRHHALFRAAQQAAHRAPGLTASESDDEHLDGLYIHKQTSKRLSARLRHSDERGAPNSASAWYDGRSGPASAYSGSAAAGYGGAGAGAMGMVPPSREWSSGLGHSIDRDLRAALVQEEREARQHEADLAAAQAGGGVGLNSTLRKAGGGRGAGAAGDGPGGDGWGGEQGEPGWSGSASESQGRGAGQPQDQGYQQQQGGEGQQQRHDKLGKEDADVTDLQDMHEKGRVIKQRPGRRGGGGSGGPQQQGSSHSSRQQHMDGQDGFGAGGGGGAVVGLPASVVLGYENLDPFQWAALMSHVAPGSRGHHGNQENVLPKPKW